MSTPTAAGLDKYRYIAVASSDGGGADTGAATGRASSLGAGGEAAADHPRLGAKPDAAASAEPGANRIDGGETTWPRVIGYFVLSAVICFALPIAGNKLPAAEINCTSNGWCEPNRFDLAFKDAFTAPGAPCLQSPARPRPRPRTATYFASCRESCGCGGG